MHHGDKNETIFSEETYCGISAVASLGQNVYLSTSHSKLSQAHLITQRRKNFSGGGWGGTQHMNTARLEIKLELERLDSTVFFLFGCN